MPAASSRRLAARLFNLTSASTAVLLPFLSPAEALAQQATADSDVVTLEAMTVTDQADKPYTVDATASSTRLSLSLRDTPQSVSVFTEQRIQDQNLQSLRDVLDNTPGVYSYAYDTERVVFTSRGFVIENMLYDGVPVPAGLNASSADPTLDTALYDRIEIVRGATGLMSGAGNPSAAINLVRKHADARQPEGSLSLSYGSWNDFRSVGDITTPLSQDGSVRARVVAVYQNRESYQDLYENEKQVFYGVVDADLSPQTRLSLGYDYQQTLPQGNTWGSFPLFFSDGTRTDWSRSVTTAADWSFWNNKTQTAFAELRHEFANGWALRSSVSRREIDGDSNLFYLSGYPDRDTGEGMEPYAYRSDDHGRQNAIDVYATGPFQLFGRKHELVVGAMSAWRHQDAYEHQVLSELGSTGNFYDWDGSYPEPTYSAEADYAMRVRGRQSAAYTALRLSLADPLKLIAGARVSQWKNSYYYIYTGPEPFEQDYNKFTPYAGLVYDFLPQWSAFASYTKIFNPQNYQRIDGSNVEPLDGYSTEVGIKGSHFGGKLNTSLTLFDTRQDNVAVATGEYIGGNLNRPAYDSADDTRSRGFELEVSGELARHWNLSAGWSYFKIEDGDGNSIRRYVPRNTVRTFTSYTLPGEWQKLTIGGGVNWRSKNQVDVYNPDFDLVPVSQKGVALASLMARYQITPKLTAQLNGDNLLDKKYYVIDEYGNLYYGQPASGTISLSYSF